ncbi:TrkA family potassium uptake protein [Erysipelotrichaceae bacterium OH741_COT-311]|nr:TrkA family potassium uptake protein [Erysipelotrichaceae bacterium]RRC94206.1 TrkA family potassium uptake protein [Erysipelotrichaceae bacterium OH741_COT-311]
MERKTYVILGLGIFGSTIATKLSELNHDVIAIDKNMECVERISNEVVQAIRADFTDIEQLKAIDIQDADVAVVATGSHLEESIMAIMNLKELKVPYILAKAKNKKYMQVLLKIGADRVIRPEREMGERVAKQLVSSNIVDLIDIDDDYSVVEIIAPKTWVNKSLIELDLRKRFGINVLGIRKKPKEHLSISPNAQYVIEENDRLLVIADKALFSKLDDILAK